MSRPLEPGRNGPEEVTDDMLMALADGELPPATAMRLRSRVLADPDLAARYAAFEATATDLRAAFAPGPVPDRLLRTVLEAPMGEAPANVTALPRRHLMRPMAMAASVVLALATGFFAGCGLEPTTPVAQADYPAALAAVALASVPTGGQAALPGDGTARVLASFQTDLGLCRMIAMDIGGQDDRAIVCRSGADWTVALSLRAGDGRGFVTASDMVTDVIDGYLDRIGASTALTAGEEAAALAP